MKLHLGTWFAVTALGVPAGEVVIPLTVDPTASELTTTLCVQDECDAVTRWLQGELLVVLTGDTAEGRAALLDLRLVATTNHHANLDFGLGGRVTAVLSKLVVRHAASHAPPAWQPVTGEAVTFRVIPNHLAGDLAYVATGLACALVGSAGLPCTDVRDLAQRDPNTIESLPGQLVIEAGRAVLTGTFRFSELIVPDQPALGQVRGQVFFSAAGDLRPRLAIQAAAGGFELRWSALAEGFALEMAETLGGPWRPAGSAPEPREGDWVATVPDGGGAYFRLRRP